MGGSKFQVGRLCRKVSVCGRSELVSYRGMDFLGRHWGMASHCGQVPGGLGMAWTYLESVWGWPDGKPVGQFPDPPVSHAWRPPPSGSVPGPPMPPSSNRATDSWTVRRSTSAKYAASFAGYPHRHHPVATWRPALYAWPPSASVSLAHGWLVDLVIKKPSDWLCPMNKSHHSLHGG